MTSSISLRDRVEADLKNAMREKAELRVSVLRMLKAAIMNAEIATRLLARQEDGKGSFDDASIEGIIRKEVKKRLDAIAAYEKAGRALSAAQEKEELGILNSYLPQMLTEEEVLALVEKVKIELNAASAKDYGRVMKEVIVRAKGRADGSTVSLMVKKALG
ncbi:MAG TPA: GatB/YqeY domain-containing protein [Patescibacteria group bacterium]|nr:GatB/YqeY domain-containing protein [Patescibacteria group bacterium]